MSPLDYVRRYGGPGRGRYSNEQRRRIMRRLPRKAAKEIARLLEFCEGWASNPALKQECRAWCEAAAAPPLTEPRP